MNKYIKTNNEQEPVQIHALSHDGRGIATINSKTTFISGALPQEWVTYKIMQKRGHFNEGETLQVLDFAKERALPPCDHFGICGGCSLQHMNMEIQLEFKQKTVLEQLKHFGKVTPENILPPLNATTIGYRRKARLGVKFVIKKNKLLVGFREKASRYLADLKRCAVLHPSVGEQLPALSALIMSFEHYHQVPQIEVAVGDTETALIFRHLVPFSETDQAKLIAFGKEHHFHIYLQPNPPASIHKLWPDDHQHWLAYTLPEYQLEFLFHPLDFTQINLDMNRLMIKQALALLDLQTQDNVLDLFCGIGNFTLPIAQHVHHAVGIEGGLDMVARAKENARRNGILNTDFFAANLQTLPTGAPWVKAQYDKILLDPPRTGAKEVLPYFKEFAAKKIVYVSCNPATLARDAGELVHQYGYKLQQAGIMNMFPHTSHIEAMALFEKI